MWLLKSKHGSIKHGSAWDSKLNIKIALLKAVGMVVVPSTGCLCWSKTCVINALQIHLCSILPCPWLCHLTDTFLWFISVSLCCSLVFFLVVWEIIQPKLSFPLAQCKSCSCGFSTFPHSPTSWGLDRRGIGAETAEGKVRTFNINLTGISLLNYPLLFILQGNTSQTNEANMNLLKKYFKFPCNSMSFC